MYEWKTQSVFHYSEIGDKRKEKRGKETAAVVGNGRKQKWWNGLTLAQAKHSFVPVLVYITEIH